MTFTYVGVNLPSHSFPSTFATFDLAPPPPPFTWDSPTPLSIWDWSPISTIFLCPCHLHRPSPHPESGIHPPTESSFYLGLPPPLCFPSVSDVCPSWYLIYGDYFNNEACKSLFVFCDNHPCQETWITVKLVLPGISLTYVPPPPP